MNLPFALRPRLFALITAIEKDCRDFLIPHLTLEDFPTDIKDKALERLDKKKLAHDLSVITLIEQIDFTHISKLLYKIKNKFTSEQQYYIKHIADQILDPLAGIRNRVCHTSPLEPDDYEKTEHFCRTLGMRGNIHSFSFVEKALSGTYNPAYNPIAKQSRITHNLPSVEYEDTGFRGRTTELEELKRRLCQHSTPIISIVGEGGIGKTAFALNCLYTIVEEDIAKFDFIVWNSFKQDRLTGKGIESINDNLSSVLNTVDSIRAFGEIEKGNATDDEIFEKILEFLRHLTN
jgi:LuxR family glucitol operon transcriptional activator